MSARAYIVEVEKKPYKLLSDLHFHCSSVSSSSASKYH